MKQKEKYEAPRTACTEVELESGLLKASIFEPENNHDDDLVIEAMKSEMKPLMTLGISKIPRPIFLINWFMNQIK